MFVALLIITFIIQIKKAIMPTNINKDSSTAIIVMFN